MAKGAERGITGEAAAITMHGVGFTWPGRHSFNLSIERFSVARGERLFLLGPSGAGKSTLLALVCGIVKPDVGSVTVLGQDLGRLNGAARDRYRAEHYGVIFQMFNLLPYASALDNVLLALAFAPHRRERVAADGTVRDQARALLAKLGLPAAATAGSLSVGQQQRVAVARALLGAPELIVADEPTSALDVKAQLAFLELLFDQASAAGSTLVMVSHDERLSSRFDRVLDLGEFATARRDGEAA